MGKKKNKYIKILIGIIVVSIILFNGMEVKASTAEKHVKTSKQDNIITESDKKDIKMLQVGGILVISLVLTSAVLSKHCMKQRKCK